MQHRITLENGGSSARAAGAQINAWTMGGMHSFLLCDHGHCNAPQCDVYHRQCLVLWQGIEAPTVSH